MYLNQLVKFQLNLRGKVPDTVVTLLVVEEKQRTSVESIGTPLFVTEKQHTSVLSYTLGFL